MHRASREAALGELVGEFLRRPLGPAEDHRQAAIGGLQGLRDQLDLVHGVRPVDELPGAFVHRALVGLLGPDVRGLRHERPGQGQDRARHGGREQHRLPLLGNHVQDALDVRQESEVEHLVGLVEHQPADLAEHQVALFGQVEQSTGGADDHIDALAQRGDLLLVGAATVDRDGAHAQVLARVGQVARDLQAQLAGRYHDESLRGAVTGQPQAVQQRDAEAEGLAGARAGLADQVLAPHRQRQGQLLDGEGLLDAGFAQRADDVRVHVQLGEGRSVRVA